MRWTPGGESSDIEDRRGSSGFGGGAPIGIGGAIILLILSLVFGKNFFAIFQGSPTTSTSTADARPVEQTPAESKEVQFVSFVLDDAQTTWEKTLGNRYHHAKLVLFRDAIPSSCGFAQAASGPFYCPVDEKVYLDLGFFDEMRDRFAATGDFAQAYVITHELGHHVQKLLGIEKRGRSDSVAIELQADCFAGIWAHSTSQRNILESGDIEEGLNAASAVGDDRLQKAAGRSVNPDTFTHGSSKQRASWFRRGYDSGRIEDCDTFRAGSQIRQ
ncbi:MAG: neutral zinc metallopeptidase [Acidobacteriota bacterium]|nr:neutral zinc metallopeptidase [Acidobacteriota bacterium]